MMNKICICKRTYSGVVFTYVVEEEEEKKETEKKYQ